MAGRRASEQCTRRKLRSPGRPPAWRREDYCRFWQAIGRGRSSEEAAADAGISTPLGPRWFRSSGGMPPTHLAPSAPALTGRFLTFGEREEIAIELALGNGIRAIARKLGRSPSTVSREVRRNAATRSGNLNYRASTAQWHSDRSGLRPRLGKLATNPALRAYVEQRLSGQITDAEGVGLSGPSCYGRSVAPFIARVVDGRPRGAPSKSPTVFGSITQRTSQCASATRRSISRCIFRGEARSVGN
jgi:hypothetical protein